MTTVAFSGKMGSGKDTAAQMFVDAFKDRAGDDYSGHVVLKFADTLKDMSATLFGVTREMMDDRDFKESVFNDVLGTPRKVQQTLGTEWGRRMIHEDIWVEAFKIRASKIGHKVLIVNTDTRFKNELKHMRDSRAITIRIERPSKKTRIQRIKLWINRKLGLSLWEHPSEYQLDDYVDKNYYFSYVVYNNGDLNDLRNAIEKIVDIHFDEETSSIMYDKGLPVNRPILR